MPLARMEAPCGLAVVWLAPLRPTSESLGAVAPLEDLQAVVTLAFVLGAHLALPQHRLADPRPEVACTAETLRTVG